MNLITFLLNYYSATAMKYNHILEELYLGDNELSSTDGPPIGAMLTYNTSLKLLDLRNNQLKVWIFCLDFVNKECRQGEGGDLPLPIIMICLTSLAVRLVIKGQSVVMSVMQLGGPSRIAGCMAIFSSINGTG